MRGAFLLLVACGAPTQTVSSTTDLAPATCGFADFAALDAAAWEARGEHATPPAVGACRLHPVEIERSFYVVRDGGRDIAKISMEGTMLLVPGLTIEGFAVGMSSKRALDRHPPDRFRIQCLPSALGNLCSFKVAGSEEEPRLTFVVDGDLTVPLEGIAAYEFFKDKPLRGVQYYTRF